MNYNLLTSSDLNAAQITSEVTEQVVTKTNRWISFWNEHVPDLISFGVEIGFSLLIFFVGRFLTAGSGVSSAAPLNVPVQIQA